MVLAITNRGKVYPNGYRPQLVQVHISVTAPQKDSLGLCHYPIEKTGQRQVKQWHKILRMRSFLVWAGLGITAWCALQRRSPGRDQL